MNFVVDPSGEVLMMNSLFVPQGEAKRTPQISLDTAKAEVERTLIEAQLADAGSIVLREEGSLAFWTNEGKVEAPRLLWMIESQFAKDGDPRLVRFGVDAETGEVHYSQQLLFNLNRTVYTNRYLSSITTPQPSQLLWVEGNPSSSDPEALSIYQRVVHPVTAWRGNHPYFYEVMGLVAHFGVSNNAVFLNGSDQKPYLFFSDPRAFDDDAIAHEYGHGLYAGRVPHEPSSQLIFWDEWFAGNEFYADLSAVITDIHRFGVRPESWAITDLRDWQEPKSKGISFIDWYPNRYFANPLIGAGYANSTIFGHAVYLMINGGRHVRAGQSALSGPIPSIDVPAADRVAIRNVLAHGLYLLVLNNDHFNGPKYKTRTLQAANALYPGSGVPTTVQKAWTAVGIGYNCSGPPATPVISVLPYYCQGKYKVSWVQAPGVKYHGEVVAQAYPWDFATTTLDAAVSSCIQNVSAPAKFRMRACNGCGCSNWTTEYWFYYYSPCL